MFVKCRLVAAWRCRGNGVSFSIPAEDHVLAIWRQCERPVDIKPIEDSRMQFAKRVRPVAKKMIQAARICGVNGDDWLNLEALGKSAVIVLAHGVTCAASTLTTYLAVWKLQPGRQFWGRKIGTMAPWGTASGRERVPAPAAKPVPGS